MKMNDVIIENLKSIQASTMLNETNFAKRCKIHQRTYNRIINNESVPKIDILEAIAIANDLHLWQVFVPHLNVKNPPVLREASEKEKEFYDKIKLAAQEIVKYTAQ
jgi:transcriptional regulator with XRE-family HTH domain